MLNLKGWVTLKQSKITVLLFQHVGNQYAPMEQGAPFQNNRNNFLTENVFLIIIQNARDRLKLLNQELK